MGGCTFSSPVNEPSGGVHASTLETGDSDHSLSTSTRSQAFKDVSLRGGSVRGSPYGGSVRRGSFFGSSHGGTSRPGVLCNYANRLLLDLLGALAIYKTAEFGYLPDLKELYKLLAFSTRTLLKKVEEIISVPEAQLALKEGMDFVVRAFKELLQTMVKVNKLVKAKGHAMDLLAEAQPLTTELGKAVYGLQHAFHEVARFLTYQFGDALTGSPRSPRTVDECRSFDDQHVSQRLATAGSQARSISDSKMLGPRTASIKDVITEAQALSAKFEEIKLERMEEAGTLYQELCTLVEVECRDGPDGRSTDLAGSPVSTNHARQTLRKNSSHGFDLALPGSSPSLARVEENVPMCEQAIHFRLRRFLFPELCSLTLDEDMEKELLLKWLALDHELRARFSKTLPNQAEGRSHSEILLEKTVKHLQADRKMNTERKSGLRSLLKDGLQTPEYVEESSFASPSFCEHGSRSSSSESSFKTVPSHATDGSGVRDRLVEENERMAKEADARTQAAIDKVIKYSTRQAKGDATKMMASVSDLLHQGRLQFNSKPSSWLWLTQNGLVSAEGVVDEELVSVSGDGGEKLRINLFLSREKGSLGGEFVAEAIGRCISVNSSVRVLNLKLIRNNCGIGDVGASAIATALALNQSLDTIILDNNDIGDQGVKALAEALYLNKSVRTLSLQRNRVGDGGAAALARLLYCNSTLRHINLYGNEIKDAGACELASALGKSSLASLDVAWNDVNLDGVKALQQAAKRHKKIRLDYYSKNEIQEESELAHVGGFA